MSATELKLIQIFQREFLGDVGELTISDQEMIAKINSPALWVEFLEQYKMNNNPLFKKFVLLKLHAFEKHLIMQRTKASASADNAAVATGVCAGLSAGFFGAAGFIANNAVPAASSAAVAFASSAILTTSLSILDVAVTGGALTAAVAVGSLLVSNYFTSEEAEVDHDIVLLATREEELRKAFEETK
jgi:hypothetical protein